LLLLRAVVPFSAGVEMDVEGWRIQRPAAIGVLGVEAGRIGAARAVVRFNAQTTVTQLRALQSAEKRLGRGVSCLRSADSSDWPRR
ncbi:MAG TPA: hypothetical protein VFP43_19380, partial [Mesorhizobium sp.]|nr:hypothetical protein [Mesorhizobium sp.]